MMELLVRHWHCILPIIGIVLAFLYMRKKPKEKKDRDDTTILLDSKTTPFLKH
jgi:hypothetical protein